MDDLSLQTDEPWWATCPTSVPTCLSLGQTLQRAARRAPTLPVLLRYAPASLRGWRDHPGPSIGFPGLFAASVAWTGQPPPREHHRPPRPSPPLPSTPTPPPTPPATFPHHHPFCPDIPSTCLASLPLQFYWDSHISYGSFMHHACLWFPGDICNIQPYCAYTILPPPSPTSHHHCSLHTTCHHTIFLDTCMPPLPTSCSTGWLPQEVGGWPVSTEGPLRFPVPTAATALPFLRLGPVPFLCRFVTRTTASPTLLSDVRRDLLG